MENIYFNCILTKKIVVESKYLDENIDNYIETYLKNQVEGVCVDEGFIRPDTIKILKKSVGQLLNSQFTGDITYKIVYTADVCNPVLGNVIDCNVKFINKLGILGSNGPITIIVGKQFHENENEINKIKEKEVIKVEVIAKKFYLNDKEIKIVAKIWSPNNKKEFISSDLTIPLNNDIENIEGNGSGVGAGDYNEEDEDDEDLDDIENDNYENSDEELEDIYDSDEEKKDIKMENPEEDNLDLDDIEIEDDDKYEENSDDETESNNDFE